MQRRSGLAARIEQSPGLAVGVALAAIFSIAFFLRVFFPYEGVFAGDWVRFQINDPWYHMRLIENLVHNYPSMMSFDPFGIYPFGTKVASAPFFDALVGFFAWLFGAGSPSERVIETVGAYFPAILGALLTVPVYFIGKSLFNAKAGLLAAALVAILPGQFMLRTLLGFTDHHAAEIMFSTLAMLFLLLAVRSSKEKGLSFASIRDRDWPAIRRPVLYAVLSGIALGCYLLSWIGGSLFVFIFFVYAIVQFVVDHVRGRSTDYLAIVAIISLVIALILIAPFSGDYSMSDLQILSLGLSILTVAVLAALAYAFSKRGIRKSYYPLAVAGMAGIGVALLYAIDPSQLGTIFDRFGSVFTPAAGKMTVSEVRRLPLWETSDMSAWGQFTTSFYLAIVSLIIVGYHFFKRGEADKSLLLVWSLTILAATLAQNRFTYYYAINVALLTGFLSWRILEFAGFRLFEHKNREEAPRAPPAAADSNRPNTDRKARRKKAKAAAKEARRQPAGIQHAYLYGFVAMVIVFFLVFYPNIDGAIKWADVERGPDDDWHDSLVWMRENTPDPFDDPAMYYASYESPAPGERYPYPESAYGVMSWWDYGYWITYIAHRMPNASPSGQAGAPVAARFFTAQDESAANTILDKRGSRYVVIDYLMATTKFYAMATYADLDYTDFFDAYYVPTDSGSLRQITLFYPEFYRSMCARLYLFDGKSWDPYEDWIKGSEDRIQAISYEDRLARGGETIKVVTDNREFTTYEDAQEWVEAHPDYRIVGTSFVLSPVPLEELEHYEPVYQSETPAVRRADRQVSLVRIFEYTP